MSMSRITKRKLDDAIEKLDNVLAPSNDTDPPSPTKRPNTSRTSSIYASLSKYKLFRSNNSSSRSPNRTISAPFALSSKPPYRPESTSDFLSRLSTYKITTYRDKPSDVNAVAAAKAGWSNEGKERLVCGYCSASWVLASTTGLKPDAANSLVEKQRVGLVANHKDSCPWKKAQCDDSVYRIPVKAPTALAKEIVTRANALSRLVDGLILNHPLTSKEVASLKETVDSVVSADTKAKPPAPENPVAGGAETQAEVDPQPAETPASPPEPALLLAVFGWDATPYTPPGQPPSPAFSSISRATSPHLSSRATTPSPITPTSTLSHRHSLSLGRASGGPYSSAVRIAHRQSMPPSASNTSIPDQLGQIAKPASIRTISGGSSSLPESNRTAGKRNTSGGSTSLSGVPEAPNVTSVVHCQLCLRRVGLWSFRPNDSSVTVADGASAVQTNDDTGRSRSLDVVKEHRSYCPYVTKTTVIPAPMFSGGPSQLSRTGSVGSSGSLRRSLSNVLSPTSNASRSRSSLDNNTPVEGWRAILTIVGRSNLGMRFRRTGTTAQTSAMKDRGGKEGRPPVARSGSVSFAVPETPPAVADRVSPQDTRMGSPVEGSDPGMEVDHSEASDTLNGGGVEKIVENVKKSKEGSRELLKYVKDLLRRGDPSPGAISPATKASSRTSLCLGSRAQSPTPPRVASPSPGAAA